jgi:hypothetical protein
MPVLQRLATGSARGFGFGVGGITYAASITELATGTDSISSTQNYTYQGSITELATGTDSSSSALAPIYWISSYYDSTTVATKQIFKNIAVDLNNNIYAVGVGNTATATSGALLVKYNSAGDLLWQRMLDVTSSTDTANAVTTDSAGNVYVAGEYLTGSSSTQSAFIAKYDSSGNLLFQKAYRVLSNRTGARGIVVDASQNIYTTGEYFTTGSFGYIVKHDSSGNIVWGSIVDVIYSSGVGIKINGTGQIIICGSIGFSYSGSNVSTGGITVYNSSGTFITQRRANYVSGGYYLSELFALAIDSSGNIYATGLDSSRYITLIKYDSSFTFQWSRILYLSSQLNNYNYGAGLVVDSLGNPYILGYNGSNLNLSSGKAVLAKYDSSGNLQWHNFISFTGAGASVWRDSVGAVGIMGLAFDSAENLCVAITGNTGSPNVAGNFGAILKLPKDGSKLGTYTVGPYGQPITYTAGNLTNGTRTYSATTTTTGAISTPAISTTLGTESTPDETSTTVGI